MEKQLFNWQGWDKVDEFILKFDGIELVKTIGKLPAGTRFDSAVVDFENGDLEFINYVRNSIKREIKEQHEFKLILGVSSCE